MRFNHPNRRGTFFLGGIARCGPGTLQVSARGRPISSSMMGWKRARKSDKSGLVPARCARLVGKKGPLTAWQTGTRYPDQRPAAPPSARLHNQGRRARAMWGLASRQSDARMNVVPHPWLFWGDARSRRPGPGGHLHQRRFPTCAFGELFRLPPDSLRNCALAGTFIHARTNSLPYLPSRGYERGSHRLSFAAHRLRSACFRKASRLRCDDCLYLPSD